MSVGKLKVFSAWLGDSSVDVGNPNVNEKSTSGSDIILSFCFISPFY